MNVSRPPQQRKVNYAVYVKGNMPHIFVRTVFEAIPIWVLVHKKANIH